MELANGCLCCSVKTEFVAALEGLLRKKSGFDYILIETTGMQRRVAAVLGSIRSASHVRLHMLLTGRLLLGLRCQKNRIDTHMLRI